MAVDIPAPVNLTGAFAADLPRARRAPTYHLGLLLTAAVMVLLPLFYLAMVLAVGWFVVWYAAHGLSVFEEVRGRAALLGYAGPLVIGVVVLGLMVKPLFAPRAEEPVWVEISRTDEPVLWAFVERLCQVVRAPAPRRIRIDCQVNASASFRRGFLSLLGNDLVLTIGLPLVAGLDLRQFTGVLAHEFGHFSQGGGMRATYIIHRINAWLARVAYQDDAWDEALRGMTASGVGFVVVVGALARLCVWITRSILKVLLFTAHAVSCFMARRMEFDADRFQTRAVGADAFEETFDRLALLGVASQGALAHAHELWGRRQLPDSLPGLTVGYLARITDKTKAEIIEHERKPRRHLFATHPGTTDRIRAARALGEPGVFTVDAPARVLFKDFRAACIRATYDEFKARVGGQIMQATFIDTGNVIAEQQKLAEKGKALDRFFRELLTARLPPLLGPEPVVPAPEPNKTARLLLEQTESIDRCAGKAGGLYKAATEALDRLEEVHQARTMFDAGLKLGMQKFNVAPATEETLRIEHARAQRRLETARGAIADIQAAHGQRLRTALSLAITPGIEKRLPHAGRDRKRAERLIPLLQRFEAVHPRVLRLQRSLLAIEALSAGLERDRKETGVEHFRRAINETRAQATTLRAEFLNEPYPFESAGGRGSIGARLLENEPREGDARAVYQAAGQVLEGLLSLHFRTLSELASIAEPVERLVLEAGRARRATAQTTG